MRFKVARTDFNGLETYLNNIGADNIIQIIPEYLYEGTLFVIVYKGE